MYLQDCAGSARFLFLSLCNCADNYERGGAIDDSVTSSIDFVPISGPVRDETGETYRRSNALIHGWGKYPWMINLHKWGATHVLDVYPLYSTIHRADGPGPNTRFFVE